MTTRLQVPSLRSSFLDVINNFLNRRDDFKSKAKHSAPWSNLLKSNLRLIEWCEAARDSRLSSKIIAQIQRYLDESKSRPVLTFQNRNVQLQYHLSCGDSKEPDFDRDEKFEPGVIAVNDFARYLDGFSQGQRRRISACRQCGKWFEWSGHGYSNKYCSRVCRNRGNYAQRRGR